MSNEKIYQNVTQNLIKVIEENKILPWQLPWDRVDLGGQQNFRTKRAYNGINAFITCLVQITSGYRSPYWLTAKEITAKKGKLKPNQKATPIVFFKVIESDDQDNETDKNGELIINKIGIAKAYRVYNLDQVDGIDFKIPKAPNYDHKKILEKADKLAKNLKHLPPIKHVDLNRAYYNKTHDFINIPPKTSFKNQPEYYSTLFHEITHATGHKKRLARSCPDDIAASPINLTRIGKDKAYAYEELIAEMGSAFLCSEAKILKDTENNSAAYLKSWLTCFKSDPNMLIRAAKEAEKSTYYLLGKDRKLD